MTSRKGFSLAEVLVAVAIVALVAALTIPTVAGRITVGEGQALAGELGALAEGIQRYHENVTKYPLRLDYLSKLPTGPRDACNLALSVRDSSAWRGPYVSREILAPASGYYVVNNDTIDNNTLTRSPAAQSGAVRNYILIKVISLDTSKASVIEQAVDGGTIDYAEGNITWTKTLSNPSRGTLVYRVPVWGC